MGKALGDRRDEAFLASKILPVLPLGPIVERRAAGSLRRLGTDRLDLYQLHQPNPVVPLTQTMPAFAKLADAGEDRPRGCFELLAGALAGRRGGIRATRPFEPGPVQPARPAARARAARLGPEAGQDRHRVQPRGTGPSLRALRRGQPSARDDEVGLGRLLRRAPATRDTGHRGAPRGRRAPTRATPAQIALAWLIRRPNVVVIPGCELRGPGRGERSRRRHRSHRRRGPCPHHARRTATGRSTGRGSLSLTVSSRTHTLASRVQGARTRRPDEAVKTCLGRARRKTVSSPRYWTVDEARASIPELRELLQGLKRAATLASQVRSNGHAALGT